MKRNQDSQSLGSKISSPTALTKPAHTHHTKLNEQAQRESEKFQSNDLGLHILVAEDNVINQKVVKSVLSRLGCTSVVVSDGSRAIAKLREERFDAVLMDCEMSTMDGFEATQLIRQSEEPFRQIPIIALTAHDSERNRAECASFGMSDYLTKPVNRAHLRGALLNADTTSPSANLP